MPQPCLTMVDTIGVQEYIFRTNDLKQIVGASFLVNCATRDWVKETLPEPNNVGDLDDPDHAYDGRTLDADVLAAEVITAGGGNSVIAFADIERAKEFSFQLTRRVLTQAPGLLLAVAHINFDITKDPLGGPEGKLAALAQEIDRMKMSLCRQEPFLGLSVTQQCDFTHHPAIEVNRNQPISAEVKAKLEAYDKADARLQQLLRGITEDEWKASGVLDTFPHQLDELGATHGERSTLAIIHMDGNGMGARFRAYSDQLTAITQNRKLINSTRALSLSIQRAAQSALQETIRYLLVNIHPDHKEKKLLLAERILLESKQLPLRPIVYGGDDSTLICDGRIGLVLASKYLAAISSHSLSDNKPLFSRAGVAIVKSHYPFSRAYQLAEQLAASAKSFIKELREQLEGKQRWTDSSGINAIDWHVAISGVVRPLDEIRSIEYSSRQGGNLTMRPLFVGDLPSGHDAISDEWRAWNTLEAIMDGFDEWRDSHNKSKALLSALVEGPNAVRNFTTIFDKQLPDPDTTQLPDDVMRCGWHDNRCVYFDAVELMDLFVDLQEVQDAPISAAD